MKRYSLLAIPAALLVGGAVLAWTPTESAKCGPSGTSYTVTLATEDDSPATFTITDGTVLASGSYTNGQVVNVTSAKAITVTEIQGNATEVDTYQPLVCATPTPKVTPHPSIPDTATVPLGTPQVLSDPDLTLIPVILVSAVIGWFASMFRFVRRR